ncbi:MAG: hypothetical protein ACE5IR_26765 [bacterium]
MAKVHLNDVIWFGLVQDLVEEWSDCSQVELESLKPRVWEIHLPYVGRRHGGD